MSTDAQKFGDLLADLEDAHFDVVRNRGSLSLQQTQRNTKKAELMEAFQEFLREFAEENGLMFYMTTEGPVIAVENEEVAKKCRREAKAETEKDLPFFISLGFEFKFKNLDFNVYEQEADYYADLAEKNEKKLKKEKSKAEKIKKDAEMYAEKERQRQERIAKLAERVKVSSE